MAVWIRAAAVRRAGAQVQAGRTDDRNTVNSEVEPMKTLRGILAAGATLAWLGCGLTAWAADPSPASTEDPLVARMAGVENIHRPCPCPWLLTGGQPDERALRALAEAGPWEVLDLRTADESRGLDERDVTRKLGLGYRNIPTRPGDFGDARFTAFRHHLISHGPQRPLFVHCASGNRVGAALLPWLVLDQGMDADAALDVARKTGLRDPELTRQALDYIRARQQPAGSAK